MISSIGLLLACSLTLSNVNTSSKTNCAIEPSSAFSENIYTPPVKNFVPDERDSYEDNDGFNVATKLYPEDSCKLTSYHTCLSATIDTYSQIIDTDYYVLALFIDSHVSLHIETDHSDYSFDLILMKDTSSLNEDKVIKNTETIYEDDSSEKSKGYQGQLRAGNYFVYIRGQQPASSGITLEYDLEIFVSKSNSPSLVSIGDMRFNKGLGGAIWLSDYLPLNTASIGEVNNEYVYYQDTGNGIDTRNYLIEDLMRISEGNPIRFATIYIWDSALRYVFYETVSALYTYFSENLKEQEIRNASIELVCDVLNNVTVVIRVLNVVVGRIFLPLKVTLTALNYLVKIVNLIIKSFIREIDVIGSVLYANYLGFLKGLLYMDFSKIEDDLYSQDIEGQKLEEVIQIPLYYSVREENFSYSFGSQLILSYKATLEKYEQNDQFLCTSSIPTTPSDCYYCYGKVYGIANNNEVDSLNSLPEYSTIPDIEPIVQNMNEEEKREFFPIELLDGEYAWYKFQAPETKTYYFLCSGGEDMIIDLFNQPIKGYSSQGIIRSYQGGYRLLSQNQDEGCYFSRSLSEMQTIYLRIRKGYYQSCPSGKLYYNDSPFAFAEPLTHTHYYERYIWKNTRNHTAYCECGESTLQGHIVSAGSSLCLLCGGKADIGFVGPLSIKYITENGSYILANGVIVLEYKDVENYLKGTLTFNNRIQITI